MTDASDAGVGGLVQQRVNGLWQPLGCFSKKLAPANSRYSTFSRELLVIYLNLEHFGHYLEGRKFPILTDHKPTIYALKATTNRFSTRDKSASIFYI